MSSHANSKGSGPLLQYLPARPLRKLCITIIHICPFGMLYLHDAVERISQEKSPFFSPLRYTSSLLKWEVKGFSFYSIVIENGCQKVTFALYALLYTKKIAQHIHKSHFFLGPL